MQSDFDLRITELGPIAARTLNRASVGRMVAVFERSAYLDFGGDLVCIGTPDIGSGPLNALVESTRAFDAIRRSRNDDVSCERGFVHVGFTSFRFATAHRWRPTPVASPLDAKRLSRGVGHVREWARGNARSEGLASLVAQTSAVSALARAGRDAVRALQAWLGDADDASLSPLVALIGLGPGLTPSGDDFLGGAIVALHCYGRAHDARRLAQHLRLEGATHPISVAHWRAACEGLCSDALHTCLRDMAEGRASRASLDRVAAIGHTSGWDALAGATTIAAALSRATDAATAD
jgi:hypothetical protein